jgi:hypothetical protein
MDLSTLQETTPRERHTPGAAHRELLAERQQALANAAAQLKAELFGIDDVIDRVIDAIRAWYVLPQLITRPVIVCLWGLTGTGKTQLTRRLAQLLGFYDRFVEVQMDGFSHGASYRSSSISGMLGDSGIHEGAPGMLVLDEFQRFRTVSTKGEEVKVERYQDVWTLLSDGRLPPALSALTNIERKLADAHYEAERADDNEEERAGKKPYRFQLDAWDAQELKRMLKLQEPLAEIMQWPPAQVQALFTRFQQSLSSWETDQGLITLFLPVRRPLPSRQSRRATTPRPGPWLGTQRRVAWRGQPSLRVAMPKGHPRRCQASLGPHPSFVWRLAPGPWASQRIWQK